jgi:co-chaperonin GroES (HSP10)
MEILGNSVLIRLDKLPEAKGSVLVPETSKEMLPLTGTIIKAGDACNEVKTGMRVQFNRKAASIVTIDGEEYFGIEEQRIMYIYEE